MTALNLPGAVVTSRGYCKPIPKSGVGVVSPIDIDSVGVKSIDNPRDIGSIDASEIDNPASIQAVAASLIPTLCGD